MPAVDPVGGPMHFHPALVSVRGAPGHPNASLGHLRRLTNDGLSELVNDRDSRLG
jgi:hypothetical protein